MLGLFFAALLITFGLSTAEAHEPGFGVYVVPPYVQPYAYPYYARPYAYPYGYYRPPYDWREHRGWYKHERERDHDWYRR